MTYKYFQVNKEDGIIHVTLNRPPVNALNTDAYLEMKDLFKSINEDDDGRVVILTGNGRAFAAGSDVNEFKTLTPEKARKRSPILLEAFQSVHACKLPVIAAVNGAALGAGFVMVASCDIIIASEQAKFSLPEVDVGVLGGGSHMQRIVPHMKARMMVLTGKKLTAEEMYRFGSIEKVVPHDKLLETATEYANIIKQKSPVAIRMAKKAMNDLEFMELFPGFQREQELSADLAATEDSKEAARAFFEKRKPVFKNK